MYPRKKTTKRKFSDITAEEAHISSSSSDTEENTSRELREKWIQVENIFECKETNTTDNQFIENVVIPGRLKSSLSPIIKSRLRTKDIDVDQASGYIDICTGTSAASASKQEVGIYEFSSPCKSQVSISTQLSQENSQTEVESSPENCMLASDAESLGLYYNAPPKKKRFKKGGLAHRLNKIIHNQKIDVAIWNHELIKGVHSTPQETASLVKMKICKEWQEFGKTVLECQYLEPPEFLNKVNELDQTRCIVIKGFNVNYAQMKVSDEITLLPPYNTKIVNYKDIKVCCFLNILKICKH